MLAKLTNQGQMLCLCLLSNVEWFLNIAKQIMILSRPSPLKRGSSYQQRAWTNFYLSVVFLFVLVSCKKSCHMTVQSLTFWLSFISIYFQPLSVYNDTRMPIPLIVQLCDKLGNPSHEPNVKVVLNCDRGIKVRALNLKCRRQCGPSGQHVRLTIQRFRVRVPLWPLPEFVSW